MPLTTSVLGVLILGESLSLNFLAGGVVIFIGMVLAAGDMKSENKTEGIKK
jgi:drug/metabolite transporter (DMT)-like permease